MPSRQDELFGPSFAREIVDIPITQEMSESFLAYSLSVITSRAIPDVRDGLKPVQRRILYAMSGMGLRPDRPHRKCAGVVGDTMGKYHPHGDGSIYDALVRMGQDFSRQITLVDPHGNFGSLDDPPAAYRYTECRLSPGGHGAAGRDRRGHGRLPPHLRRRARGARSTCRPACPTCWSTAPRASRSAWPPTCRATTSPRCYEAIKLVMTKRRPKPTVAELMAVLPGPDFPSGGTIIDDGIADAYATGRGSFRIRAKAEIEPVKGTKRHRHHRHRAALPRRPRAGRRPASRSSSATSKIVGIAEVKNLSDRRSGLNLVIEAKPGVNPEALLTELYRLTPLEESFGVNNVVLVDGVPTTVGIWELCNFYIEHRLDVIVRRTEYRLGQGPRPAPHRRRPAHRARRDRSGRRDHPLVGRPGRGARTGSWPSCRSPRSRPPTSSTCSCVA